LFCSSSNLLHILDQI